MTVLVYLLNQPTSSEDLDGRGFWTDVLNGTTQPTETTTRKRIYRVASVRYGEVIRRAH